jgi:SAM-dependent methyltransferase
MKNLIARLVMKRRRNCAAKKATLRYMFVKSAAHFIPLGKKAATSFNYDDYYDENNLAISDFVERRLTEIMHSFEKYRQNNRFLDVGCGAGTLLTVALNEAWQAEGIEVSRSSVEFLRKQDIKVFHGDLPAARFSEGSFDVAAAIEILEHIPEPINILKEIYQVFR